MKELYYRIENIIYTIKYIQDFFYVELYIIHSVYI